MKEESDFTKNHIVFKEKLLELSYRKLYGAALREWEFVRAYERDNNCICGHHIKRNCDFINTRNGNEITVGSTCVKKFFKQDYDFHFKKKKSKTTVDIQQLLNKKYTLIKLKFYYDNKIVTEWEYNFIKSLYNYKFYSEKQNDCFMKIHNKIKIIS